jgi:hypothetical protein
MTAPVVASSSSDKAGECLTDITVTFSIDGPSTANANNAPNSGELYIVCAAIVNSSSTPAIALPSGFTLIGENYRNTGTTRNGVHVSYRIMDGSETTIAIAGTPDSVTQGLVAKVLRVTGHNTVTPVNASVVTTFGSSPRTLSAVTTTVADCMVFFVSGSGSSNVVTHTWGTNPEQWDFGSDPAGAGGSAADSSASKKTQVSAGSSGTDAVTTSAAANISGVTFAIAPALAAGHSRLPLLNVG